MYKIRKIFFYTIIGSAFTIAFFKSNVLAACWYVCQPTCVRVCEDYWCPAGTYQCGGNDCCPVGPPPPPPEPPCSPVPCRGCTPTCPAGQSTVVTGPLCAMNLSSCTGNNGCGSSCTLYGSRCYLPETNVQQTQPESLNIIVDGEIYPLSTISSNPTKIKYPSTENNVKVSIPSRTAPPTSRGLGYAFRANNFGVNDEWVAWNDCSSARPEDFCIEGLSNTQNFQPSSMSILDVLKQNAKGNIGGMYYTINKCNDTKVYSSAIQTYYEVNNNPKIADVCDWNSALLANDPQCINPDGDPITEPVCEMIPDQVCTKEEYLPNVGGESSISMRGCMSTEYTGIESNNPLRVRVGATDPDGNGEIEGTIVWFSKSNNPPEIVDIQNTYTSTNPNEIGIMILKNGNSWINTPSIYGINKEGTWGKLGSENKLILDGAGASVIVSKVEITEGTNVVTFEIELAFQSQSNTSLSGMYSFMNLNIDEYMLMEGGNKIDQSHMGRYFNWGIDLVSPVVERPSQTVQGAQTLTLDLDIDGTGTNVKDIVFNGYREGGVLTAPISLTNPSGYDDIFPSNGIPSEDQMGHILGEYANNTWHLSNINQPSYTGSLSVDIGGNEGGTILIYTTAHDQACNASARGYTVDLRAWIATQGGVIYTQDSLGPEAKEITDGGPFTQGGQSTLRNYSLDEILGRLTTATEMVSSRRESINRILYSEVIKAVRANYIYDSNDKKNYWYEYFSRRLEMQKSVEGLLTEFSIAPGDTSVSQKCFGSNCYMESNSDIIIPKGYICDKNTLIKSRGNITLNPDISSSDNFIEGCIFLAKDKIIVTGGDRQSSASVVGYDYIEGFLISEDQIVIEASDEAFAVRDGLEIKGGAVAFGRDSSNLSAFMIQRNLRLYSYSNPTVVITWDPRYAKLSEIFFETEAAMYKQEVGFKAF